MDTPSVSHAIIHQVLMSMWKSRANDVTVNVSTTKVLIERGNDDDDDAELISAQYVDPAHLMGKKRFIVL